MREKIVELLWSEAKKALMDQTYIAAVIKEMIHEAFPAGGIYDRVLANLFPQGLLEYCRHRREDEKKEKP